MVCGKAEDAGGLSPVKDDNAAAHHFIRRTLTIWDRGDYMQAGTGCQSRAGSRLLGKGRITRMEEKPVSLHEIMDARERRFRRQQELLIQFHCTLISFTMNIAGPIKNSGLISRGFDTGKSLIGNQLNSVGIQIQHQEESRTHTGCEAFIVVKADPVSVKRLAVEAEDCHPIGRLFDMDVLTGYGIQVSRRQLGFPERKCLICGGPAKECASRRIHSAGTLQEKTTWLLRKYFDAEDARTAARLASQSLLYEVCATPKPGLVDRANSGSHQDMDIFTFMSSVSALWPYFEECAEIGRQTAEADPAETFQKLRWSGKLAEQAMWDATKGVNTHKGAIFSMGILCGALGRLPRERWREPELILAECARMTVGLTDRDFRALTAQTTRTAGQRLFAKHGLRGIRGEAEQGFPAVLNAGLPKLEQGVAQGLSLNDAGCAALLALMTAATDTNLIARSDRQTQLWVTEQTRALLEQSPFPDRETLDRLDKAFIQENLSPGGSADLLAMTYMLYFLKRL